MHKKLFFVLLLVASYNQFSCAMQLFVNHVYNDCKKDFQEIREGWKYIKSWKDVEPFAGKIVAKKSTSYQFNKGCKLNPDSDISSGYVENFISYWEANGAYSDEEKGYNMHRLLSPNQDPSNCALVKSKLKNADLLLRKATSEEIKKIIGAIIANKAMFEYIDKEKVFKILGVFEYVNKEEVLKILEENKQ